MNSKLDLVDLCVCVCGGGGDKIDFVFLMKLNSK